MDGDREEAAADQQQMRNMPKGEEIFQLVSLHEIRHTEIQPIQVCGRMTENEGGMNMAKDSYSMSRQDVINNLRGLVRFGNLTEEGEETVRKAIDIIIQGEDAERAERILVAAEVLSFNLKRELKEWKERNMAEKTFPAAEEQAEDPADTEEEPAEDPWDEQGEPHILDDDEIRMIAKPALVWREEKLMGYTVPMEILDAGKDIAIDDETTVEAILFAEGFDDMAANRKVVRYWNRKPTEEQRMAAAWPEIRTDGNTQGTGTENETDGAD